MKAKTGKMMLIGLGLFILTLGMSMPMAAPDAYGEVKQLSMGTSSVGGLFYNLGAPVAQCINKNLPEVNVTAEFTEGSTENLRLIHQKKMQLAVISPMIGHFARNGLNMFKGKPVNMKVVVRLLPNGNIWAVLKSNKDIKTIRDIKGKRVGVGTGGIGVMSRMQLAAHGIDYKKDIKPFFSATGELATLLKDGKVDASFLTEGLAKQVLATHQIRLISWQDADRKKYISDNPYFGEFNYKPNHFKGIDYAVQTVDNGIQLITHADTDEALVYKLAKAIIENLDCVAKIFAPAKALNPKWCASELGNPFHPGSLKYFKDAGLM